MLVEDLVWSFYNHDRGGSMRRRNKISFILALTFTIFILVGASFDLYSNLSLFKRYKIALLGVVIVLTYLFQRAILYTYQKIEEKERKVKKKKPPKKLVAKFYKMFDQHPFLTSFTIIFLGWIIYVIAFYPAILSPDPSYQILQYFGIDNKYSYYSVLLDKRMIITNHHPVFHTLLLGSFIQIGLLFQNFNLGIFLYSLVQILILNMTLSYTIIFMKSIGTSRRYLIYCLLIYTLVPVFPFYAMSPVKDVIFTCFMIFYLIFIYQYAILKSKISFLKTFFVFIMIVLFRNNGIHILIFSLPFLFLVKERKKRIIVRFLVAILLFYISYHNILLPHFKITPGSIREMLSVPFQQTARYVKYYDLEVTEKEKKIIDKVLDYPTLKKRYQPQKADFVKNKFNRFSTKTDLKAYFKVWLHQGFKHPKVYLESFLANTCGYFSPLKTNWYIYNSYHKYHNVLKKHHLNYSYNSLKTLRVILSTIGIIFPYIPVLGLFVNIGFSTWIIFLMISYFIYKRNYQMLFIFLPSLLILGFCLLSPVNTYFRYAMPNIFSMPLLIAFCLKEAKEQ